MNSSANPLSAFRAIRSGNGWREQATSDFDTLWYSEGRLTPDGFGVIGWLKGRTVCAQR
jgi:hypothetical protein